MTANNLSDIQERIDRQRLIRLLVEAVNHYSPSYAEMPATRVFADALKKAGIEYRLQPLPSSGEEERANLIICLGPAPPALLWVGHVDTVALWYEGDYRARISGDTLYGLGAADMKGGCAAIVEALIALKESSVALKKGLCVALVVGEEEYGDGSEAIVDSLHAPLTIIGEPTSLFPCTAHYGYLECRLVSIGLRAHAALPEVGANAIHGMLTWMTQILNECQTLDFADRLAVNPREIRGGEPGFVVAESCEMLIDFHLPPLAERKPLESVIGKAREFVLQSHRDISLSYEAHFWSPGYNHSGKDRRLVPVRDAYKKMGLVWQTEAFRSHSDAGLFYPTGTLPLVCGPGDLAVAHRRGECVSLTEVERAARLYAAIIYETCVV